MSLLTTTLVVKQFVLATSKKKTLHCFFFKFYLLARAAFVSVYENQTSNLSE